MLCFDLAKTDSLLKTGKRLLMERVYKRKDFGIWCALILGKKIKIEEQINSWKDIENSLKLAAVKKILGEGP